MLIMPTLVAAVAPLPSLLIGALITYYINIRARRSNRIEDLFNEAISAVAVADASARLSWPGGLENIRPQGMSYEDYRQIENEIWHDAVTNSFNRRLEAREAIARVLPYASEVKPYYTDVRLIDNRIQEAMDVLLRAKSKYR